AFLLYLAVSLAHQLACHLGIDLCLALRIGFGQGRAADRLHTQVVMMCALAIERNFQTAQAARAIELPEQQSDTLVPAAKALAVLVALVLAHEALEDLSRQALHQFLKSAYPKHVAGPVIELALNGLTRFTASRNPSRGPRQICSGQQCAKAGTQRL